jgi:YjbE family integral membrane protein
MDMDLLAAAIAFVQVVLVDLILAGDNAIVVAMAVNGLPLEQRGRAMLAGIVVATVLRIAFATVIVQLLQVIGLVLAGGLLLIWVCWKLWRELRSQSLSRRGETDPAVTAAPASRKTLRQAIIQIVIADVSMSLDNVLAVAGVAREHAWVLVAGLVLSVAFMGLAAVMIARLLGRHHWIGYVGLAVILYVALTMIWQGAFEVLQAAGI